MLKGGGGRSTTSIEVVLTLALEVLAILKGGLKVKFPNFKWVGDYVPGKLLPCLEGVGGKQFRTCNFQRPLRVINDHSLIQPYWPQRVWLKGGGGGGGN